MVKVAEDFGPVINPDGTPSGTTIAFAREMGTLDKLRQMFPNWKEETDNGHDEMCESDR